MYAIDKGLECHENPGLEGMAFQMDVSLILHKVDKSYALANKEANWQ